ncbi:RidA family protein [Tistrella mobilis]|uniref:RidA family protein n=1 Tax=Tistrella mobilis TaxID=171437 RepID=UPI00355646E9
MLVNVIRGLWRPFGAFSMAAVQESGRIVHLKGQVPLDAQGELAGPGDIQAQFRQVLENIRTALVSFGGEMSDVLSLSQHTTDIEKFIAASAVRSEFFASPFPVTTTVEVVRLYRPDVMIEITAVAEIPIARFRTPKVS